MNRCASGLRGLLGDRTGSAKPLFITVVLLVVGMCVWIVFRKTPTLEQDEPLPLPPPAQPAETGNVEAEAPVASDRGTAMEERTRNGQSAGASARSQAASQSPDWEFRYVELKTKYLPLFKPPSAGERMVLTLSGGTSMEGVLYYLDEGSVSFQRDSATVTMKRTDFDVRTRVRLFADDFASYYARRDVAKEQARAGAIPVDGASAQVFHEDPGKSSAPTAAQTGLSQEKKDALSLQKKLAGPKKVQ